MSAPDIAQRARMQANTRSVNTWHRTARLGTKEYAASGLDIALRARR